MFSKVISSAIDGISARVVHVETDVGCGLPMFEMGGYLGTEVKEARDRVRIAIKNSGIQLEPKKIVVNISPADIRKDGTGFDLPIAVGVLISYGVVSQKKADRIMMIGELSLDGRINPVNGILPMICDARKQGLTQCIIPYDNLREGAMIDGMRVLGAASLAEVIDYFNHDKNLSVYVQGGDENISACESNEDFLDIRGQAAAKRATMVAVAGMHNIIYVGPPGSGKTMLARRIPTIMPDMSYSEKLMLTQIYSVAGQLSGRSGLIEKRPFRSPHHNITASAMFGGGNIPRPGEVTLSGKGVLFLDEMTEFRPDILEALRQPLEDKQITIVRMNAAYTYPADFMLVAAINPCKCGYYPDRNRCRCSERDIKRYIGRISNPMWDRFDVCIKVDEVSYKEISGQGLVEADAMAEGSSAYMRKRIEAARQIQQERFQNSRVHYNSEMNAGEVKKYCRLGSEEQKFMERAYEKMHFTARGYHKILKTARTIADMDEHCDIHVRHLSEAIFYKCNGIKQ